MNIRIFDFPVLKRVLSSRNSYMSSLLPTPVLSPIMRTYGHCSKVLWPSAGTMGDDTGVSKRELMYELRELRIRLWYISKQRIEWMNECYGFTNSDIRNRNSYTSFLMGEVPFLWRVANITPIPKKPGSDISFFRPISALSVPGKLIDSIVAQRISYTAGIGSTIGSNPSRVDFGVAVGLRTTSPQILKPGNSLPPHAKSSFRGRIISPPKDQFPPPRYGLISPPYGRVPPPLGNARSCLPKSRKVKPLLKVPYACSTSRTLEIWVLVDMFHNREHLVIEGSLVRISNSCK